MQKSRIDKIDKIIQGVELAALRSYRGKHTDNVFIITTRRLHLNDPA